MPRTLILLLVAFTILYLSDFTSTGTLHLCRLLEKQPFTHQQSRYLAVSAQVVFAGVAANIPMVARVAIADYHGNLVLDTLVRPTLPVTDYRHAETGLQPVHLAHAPDFHAVQQRASSLIHNKIIVGYALWQFLSHVLTDSGSLAPRDRYPRRRRLHPLPTKPAVQTTVASLRIGQPPHGSERRHGLRAPRRERPRGTRPVSVIRATLGRHRRLGFMALYAASAGVRQLLHLIEDAFWPPMLTHVVANPYRRVALVD
ncbi:hypothetical protein EW146_g1512 [Bondarzewia mesenterica]|uniref:Exonuclease domain-containing protein n=1 Tax=Bondarzewia mesenterica TaxID=1095465 RepID=A0A4S4M3Q6_9AGAM|nr:hypothetical protein EW146_g1512 [Bondarzewia mesenterica]